MIPETDKHKQTSTDNKPQFAGPAKPRSKGKNLIIALILLLVVVVGAMATKSKLTGPDQATKSTYIAQRGDLSITVTEGGSIRSKKSTNYTCEVERRGGELNILNIVPAGTYVTQDDVDKGMVLIELDSSSLKEALTREKMELTSDQESMTSAVEAFDIQKRQNESNVASDKLKRRFALLALQKYLGNSLAKEMTQKVEAITSLTDHVAPFLQNVRQDPNVLNGSAAGQELKSLNDSIVLAEGNLKTAQATLAGTEQLHKADYVSALDLKRDQLTVVNRKFSLENSIVNRDLFLRYDFPKNTEQFLSDYIEAGRQLERTYAQCRSMVAQAQARLSSAEENLSSQKRRVEWYEEQIAKCTIKARAPGLVIYGTGGSGDAYSAMRRRGGGGGGGSGVIAAGESVYQGQTLISMPDTVSMVAEISVHETEVDKVRPGQPTQIVMDAFPDKILDGEVIEVAPLPDQQRGFMNPDLKVYTTLISINGTHDFLRTRMSCKVEIFVREINEVILVPIQVVANRGGRKVLFILNKGNIEERVVKTGAFNDSFVQIIEGLQENEEVLLNPPLFTESRESPSSKRPRSNKKTDGDDQDKSKKDFPDTEPEPEQTDSTPENATGDRRGSGRSGRPGTGGRPQMTDEMKEQMKKWGEMSEEEKAKMRQSFGQRGRPGADNPAKPEQSTPEKSTPIE
ncbi:MAG: HlyD family efflux transporter periplasmic adaptor subunit [Phycisphaerae bacterium]|nr:HlyD family efflux transporter periplasmic adaptor subunit [Phycisphaerae bacterium]